MNQHKEVLQQKDFRRLLIARIVSSFGNGMSPTALAFAIFALPNGNGSMLSFVLAANAVPLVLMLPLGGVIADRVGRARVIASTDMILSAVILTQAYLFTIDTTPIVLIAGLAACAGVLNAIWYPAYPGLPADLLEDNQLQTGNSYISFGSNAAMIFGAASGGWLVHLYGGAVALAVDAVTFFVAGAIVWGLRHTSTRTEERESVITELVDGWRVFWSYKWVVVVVASFSLVVMCLRASEGVLGPLVARDHFDGAVSWSQVTAAEGVGLLLGAALATKWRPSRPMVAGMLVTITAPIFMWSMAAPAPLPVIAAAAFMWGIGIELMVIMWFTALQTHIPKEAIGRVSAYDAFGSLMFGPIGLALAGPLSFTYGTGIVLICAGALSFVMILLSLLSRDVRALRYIEAEAAA